MRTGLFRSALSNCQQVIVTIFLTNDRMTFMDTISWWSCGTTAPKVSDLICFLTDILHLCNDPYILSRGKVMFIFAQVSCLPLSKKSWTSGVDPDRLRIPPSPWYCSGGAWGHFILEERKSGPPVKFISNYRSMCSTLNFCLKCGTLWLCICKLYGLSPPLQHWPHSSRNFAAPFALSSCDVALPCSYPFPSKRPDEENSFLITGTHRKVDSCSWTARLSWLCVVDSEDDP